MNRQSSTRRSRLMAILAACFAMPSWSQTDPFAERVVEGDLGIQMVVVDGGDFLMGSPDGEPGRSDREGPQQTVSIAAAFALSRTEISVGQFRRFVEATGYVSDIERAGRSEVFDMNAGRMTEKSGVNWRHDFRGREADDELPVIRISWNDAQVFIEWLSSISNRRYRLPSEAEFEYALRAGTATRYWWGNASPDRTVENLPGDRERVGTVRWPVGFRGYSDRHFGPSPVASFEPNPFGLFDMGGNAAEWVDGCYSAISDIPPDGSPSPGGDCSMRVFRGAAWAYPPPLARSAYRNAGGVNYASPLIGFRVASDLTEATAQREE